MPVKFYFHVDGLDEFCGNHREVIHILQDLSGSSYVKQCLSSRPHIYFEDAFGKCEEHVLRLHELTEDGIKLFAGENLLSYQKNLESIDPVLFANMVNDISNRAQGVFLWVRLVVVSLSKGLQNGDSISILQERLQALPTELEEFSDHILISVEPIYHKRIASAFLVALKANTPMKIIHYSFLEEQEQDPTLCFKLPYERYSDNEI